jgi:hypothetical protein
VGDDRAILVNRDYKPVGVGIPYSYWVDYAAFPQWHLSGATLARLRAAPCWVTNQEGLNHFMFHDGCPPWASARDLRAYEARLRALIHAYSEGIAAGPPWP